MDLPAPEGQPKEPVPRALTPKPLLSAPVRNGESLNLEDLASLFLDAQGDLHPNFLERSHLRKVRTFPGSCQKWPCLSLTNSLSFLVYPEGPLASVQGRIALSGSQV